MALVLADGQLSSTSTSLVTPTGNQYVAVTLFNTSSTATVTVLLTLARQGGTARTFARAVLLPYESLYIRGLGLDSTDVLAGSATQGTTVDYTVHWDRDDSDFLIFARDATGAAKAGTTVSVEIDDKSPDKGQVEMIRQLDEMIDLLRRIA